MAGEIQLHASRSGVRVRLPEAGAFATWIERLGQQLADGPALSGKAVTVDAGRRQLSADELRALEAVFLERGGATLLQVTGGQAAAHAAPAEPSGEAKRAEPAERPEPERAERPAAAPPRAAFQPEPCGDTLLIKRTLRSGQRVRFNGNVVVLGDVNPGAEIVASGDIVVMGTLRGVAHAGATGEGHPLVAAFRLQATQLRLGAVIGRSPDGGIVRPDAPEVARLRDGVVVIERYLPAVADLADWQANGG